MLVRGADRMLSADIACGDVGIAPRRVARMGEQWESSKSAVELTAASVDGALDPLWVGAARAEQPEGVSAVAPEATPSVLEGASARVLFNTLVQTVGKFVGYACALVTLALTTRLLGTTRYGDYTIVVVYLSFFVMLADSGITTAGVREAAKFPEKLQGFVDTVFSLKLVLGLLTYLAAAAIITVIPTYPTSVKLATYGLALSFFFLSLAVSWDVVFQSQLRMQIPAFADVVLKVVTLLGTGALFWYQAGHSIDEGLLFFLVVAITALGNLSAAAVRGFGALRLVRLRLRFDRAASSPLLRIAVPLAIVSVLGQVHYKADTILLSFIKPAQDVAIYGVAYRVVDILLVFFAVLVSVVFPVLARYAHAGGERYQHLVTRVLNAALSIACPVALGVGLLAPGIVSILGGPAYAQAALPLTILAVSLVFSLLNMFYDYLIIAGDRQVSLIWVVCINIVANIALNLYAIPRYSYVGSAVATCVTEGLGVVLAMIIANRLQRSLPSLKGLVQVLVACAAMGGVIVLVERLITLHSLVVNTVMLTALGALVYGVVLLAAGGVDPRMVDEVVRRLPVLKDRAARLAGDR
jgi:O-antigen/teichoic acid export membrane protein